MLIKNQCINNEIKEIKTHLETLTHSYTKIYGMQKSSLRHKDYNKTDLFPRNQENSKQTTELSI